MLLLVAAIAWTVAIAVLLVRAVRQYSYFEVLHADPAPMIDEAPYLHVIVPARNEEHNLPRCLRGLLAQDYPAGRFSLTVIDDHSTDATPDIVRTISKTDDRVHLMQADPLPAGWTGKAHACWQAARSAGVSQAAGKSEWLCFIDADTASEPALLKTAMRESIRRDVGLLSLSPFQELDGVWERLIMPAGFFLIAFTQDLRGMNNPATMDVHANGQFLLIRADAYNAAGTFAAVAKSVAEDSAIARAVKRAGYRVAMLGTQGLIRTRMYSDLPSLWEGLARQANELLGSAFMSLVWAVGAILLGWVAVLLPIWAILNVRSAGAHPIPLLGLIFALAGSLSLLGTHIGAAHYFRIPLIYGILFPISYTLGAGLLLTGAIERRRGRVLWKGRAYAHAPQGSS